MSAKRNEVTRMEKPFPYRFSPIMQTPRNKYSSNSGAAMTDVNTSRRLLSGSAVGEKSGVEKARGKSSEIKETIIERIIIPPEPRI